MVLASLGVVGCGAEASDGVSVSEAARAGHRAARLIAPLSTTHTPNEEPLFVWELPKGAHGARVEICRDRACADPLMSFLANGTSGRPDSRLPGGVVFWRAVALGPGRHESPPSATWEIWTTGMHFPQPGLAGPPADTTWGSVLDINGDGFADLAIGAPGGARGFVSFYLGGPDGPAAVPCQTLEGPPGFGTRLASAGDVNGDGYADLAVAATGTPGSVFVYLGGPDGLSPRRTSLDPGPVTADFGSASDVTFGDTLAPAGDVNQDGYADLLVGGREVAQIYFGGPSGIHRTAALALAGDDAGGAGTPNATSVSGGADVNGDRIPDVIVRGHSYLGTGSGFTLQPGPIFQDGRFAGDVNGDGLTDYAGGSVFPGTPLGISPAPQWSIPGQYFFTGPGDTNGDGFAEMFASTADPWRVHYGNPLGCNQGADCGLPQNPVQTPGALPSPAGWSPVGDVNGDGLEDLAVGVPADSAVYLFLAPDVPPTPTRTITGPGNGFGTGVE
jgi:hypothetical protein